MSNFVVEVSLPERLAHTRINHAVRTVGSHFATHADWRRGDGVYIGAIVIDADDEQAALAVVPPGLRTTARVVPRPAMAA